MIARLTGILAETTADSAVLDVAGVGYLILASARTLDAIGPIGGTVMLLTEMQVREDSMTLFGFGNAGERESFRSLTSVQGVGGRVARGNHSGRDPAERAPPGSRGAQAMGALANGRGPKLAMRIVNELAGKLGNPALAATAGSPTPRGGVAHDALSALANLGFKPADASAAVAAAVEELGDGATLDALVRLALRKAAR